MIKPQSIGVFGIGAIGSVISLGLTNQPHESLYLFNRSQRNSIAVYFNNQLHHQKIQLSKPQDVEESLDYLIICLKLYHFEDAQTQIQKIIRPNTKLIIVRNGLHHGKEIEPSLQHHPIIPAIIDCPTQTQKDGSYVLLQKGQLTLPKTDSVRLIKPLLNTPYYSFKSVTDFHSSAWLKLIESACLGGILASLNKTCQIFEDSKVRNWHKQLVDEAIRVAQADGAIIPHDTSSRLNQKLLSYPSTKGSSMLSDRRSGRPIEWMAKNGAIIQLAKKHGISAPYHRHIEMRLREVAHLS